MNPVTDVSPTPLAGPGPRNGASGRSAADSLPLWRLYLLRFGYFIIAAGLAAFKWPEIISQDRPWPLFEGVVNCILAAMSLLALLGIRYPVQMLPLLFFESTWKLIWLGVVALPQWTDGQMDEPTQEVAISCLWVVIVLVAIPWRYVFAHYVAKPGDRWR